MTNVSTHEYLNSLTNYESHLNKITSHDFHLDRVKQLLAAVGNPQEKLKIIHVAGTKGKGSTCAMICSILQQAGYRLGLYTSPHLHRINERIRVLDQANLNSREDFCGSISDDDLTKWTNLLRPQIASIENKGGFLTYFEVLTVLAIIHFVQQKVDFAVLETGLGGRLDATNAVQTFMTVITPISLDHMKILGNSLQAIAKEKAGIIKSSKQLVVIAPQEQVVMDIFNARCREYGIQPQMVHPTEHRQLNISLKGEHQIVNAACAITAVGLLQRQGVNISPSSIEEGLKKVRWQGRFEIVKEKPVVVLDGAHNPASALALAKTIQDEYHGRRIVFVLGFSNDKDIAGSIEPLKRVGDTFILSKANHPRAYEFDRQEAHDIFLGKEWFLTQNIKDALKLAFLKTSKEDVIVVTGSLFIVAEVRVCINSKP